MTSKQKRLNTELHRKVSILTEKTKDFLKASQAAVVEEVQCEIAGHVWTPTAKAARTLPSPTQRTRTGSSPGIVQRPQASPCEGKGKRRGQRRAALGKGGLRAGPPVATKAAETSHSTASSDSSAADRFGSFPPAFLSFIL